MSSRRFSFLPPSCGDRLLRQARTLRLEVHRFSADPLDALADELGALAGDEPRENIVELSYEVKGELPLKSTEADELLAGLVHEFRQPIGRGKGGAA